MKRLTTLDFDPEDLRNSGKTPGADAGADGLAPCSSEQYPPALADTVAAYRQSLHMLDDAPALVTISAVAANRIQGLAPCWLMLVAAPSAGKTSLIEPISRVRGVEVTGSITEAGLLSGSSKKDRMEGATGGLLLSVANPGVLAIKDLGSILSMHADKRAPLLAALREIYDGSWVRHLGTDGGLTLSWSGHLGVIAACTTAVDKHHALMQSLGDRFLYVRVRNLDPLEQARAAVTGGARGIGVLADRIAALIHSMPTVPPELDAEEVEFIAQLSELAVRMRSAADRDGYSREVVVTPEAEAPGRMAKALKALDVGMCGVGVPRTRRLQLLLRVALDSMPEARRRLIGALSGADNVLPIDAMENASGVHHQTVRRHLENLESFGIVTINRGPCNGAQYSLRADVRQRLHGLLQLAGLPPGRLP